MLTVVEGVSAIGKTTVLRGLPTGEVIAEEWEALEIPRGSGPSDPWGIDAQRYWVDLHTQRWALMLAAERTLGRAFADTDPLKLHYNFSLVMTGHVSRSVFDEGYRATKCAMERGQLGFADHVVILSAAFDVVVSRKAADSTRRRRAFDLHVQLSEWLDAYYAVLSELRPGSVHRYELDNDESSAEVARFLRCLPDTSLPRYDLATLDSLKERLDWCMDKSLSKK